MSASRTKTLHKANRIIAALVGIFDNINLGLIFVFKQFFPTLLEESAKYAFFPFAALAVILQAALGWNLVHIDSGKQGSQILNSIIATLTAISITTAVVISLAFGKTPLFGIEPSLIAPIIFAATIGTNTLIHLANSAYYSIKALQIKPTITAEDSLTVKTEYPEARSKHWQAVVNNLLSAGLSAEITATIITVMICEQTQLSAALGGTTALTGNLFMLYLISQQIECCNKKKQSTIDNDVEAARPLLARTEDNNCCLSVFSLFNRNNAHNGYMRVPATVTELPDEKPQSSSSPR
jgi:hypothetical protein